MQFAFSFYLLVTCGYFFVTCGYLVVTSFYLIAATDFYWTGSSMDFSSIALTLLLIVAF